MFGKRKRPARHWRWVHTKKGPAKRLINPKILARIKNQYPYIISKDPLYVINKCSKCGSTFESGTLRDLCDVCRFDRNKKDRREKEKEKKSFEENMRPKNENNNSNVAFKKKEGSDITPEIA